MNFEDIFVTWTNKLLAENIPAKVVAFSFNLYETNLNFGIELIGSESFSEADEDWACDEIFEPLQRRLEIPVAYSGDRWERCLEKMAALLLNYLNSTEPGASVLNAALGVGIGFVDGNLLLLKKS